MIHQPIPAIPPGFELRTSIDRLETRLKSDSLPKLYKVTVTYTGGLNDAVRKIDYLLDLNMFHGILETHKSSLTDMTHVVQEIPRQLERLTDRVEEVSGHIEQLAEKNEPTPQLLENLSEISKAIEALDATMKSKNTKIW